MNIIGNVHGFSPKVIGLDNRMRGSYPKLFRSVNFQGQNFVKRERVVTPQISVNLFN